MSDDYCTGLLHLHPDRYPDAARALRRALADDVNTAHRLNGAPPDDDLVALLLHLHFEVHEEADGSLSITRHGSEWFTTTVLDAMAPVLDHGSVTWELDGGDPGRDLFRDGSRHREHGRIAYDSESAAAARDAAALDAISALLDTSAAPGVLNAITDVVVATGRRVHQDTSRAGGDAVSYRLLVQGALRPEEFKALCRLTGSWPDRQQDGCVDYRFPLRSSDVAAVVAHVRAAGLTAVAQLETHTVALIRT